MRRPGRRPALLFSLIAGAFRRRSRREEEPQEPIVEPGEPRPRTEVVVAVLLLLAAAAAIAFVAIYGLDRIGSQTQFLGLAIGVCFALLAAAFVVGSKLVEETDSEEYGLDEPGAEGDVRRILRESGKRFTRKRLLLGAGGAAAGSVGAALVAPAISLGPVFDTEGLRTSAWRRGTRLVDEQNRPYKADDIEEGTFYTAYPEHEGHDRFDAPLIVVRLPPGQLKLPDDRAGWAPDGLLAYSKVCTHAGCAVAMYRKPLFAPTEPRPALVCPCHYSTFDPARGGEVIFGPAGRPLPQLPLEIDAATRELRAGGTFSGYVGPSWWDARGGRPRYEPSGPEGTG